MISTRSVELVIDTVVCLTLAKWETVSGHFGGYLTTYVETFTRRATMDEKGIARLFGLALGGLFAFILSAMSI